MIVNEILFVIISSMKGLPVNPKVWFNSLKDSVRGLYDNAPPEDGGSDIEKALFSLLKSNYTLWRYEDEVRRRDIPDADIAEFKRKIDRENQRRNDIIDRIDALFEKDIEEKLGKAKEALPLNSETPGSIFDRLTILALRAYNLKKQAERQGARPPHIERCRKMLMEVEERSGDLVKCLEELLMDYYSGKKRLKSYRQHKLYNDPDLNPALQK